MLSVISFLLHLTGAPVCVKRHLLRGGSGRCCGWREAGVSHVRQMQALEEVAEFRKQKAALCYRDVEVLDTNLQTWITAWANSRKALELLELASGGWGWQSCFCVGVGCQWQSWRL